MFRKARVQLLASLPHVNRQIGPSMDLNIGWCYNVFVRAYSQDFSMRRMHAWEECEFSQRKQISTSVMILHRCKRRRFMHLRYTHKTLTHLADMSQMTRLGSVYPPQTFHCDETKPKNSEDIWNQNNTSLLRSVRTTSYQDLQGSKIEWDATCLPSCAVGTMLSPSLWWTMYDPKFRKSKAWRDKKQVKCVGLNSIAWKANQISDLQMVWVSKHEICFSRACSQ